MASNKTILKKAKEKAKILPYLFPIGIIVVIIGSTFGARKGNNLNKNTAKNKIVYFQVFIRNS
jgi:hypothetical protein